MTLDQHDGEQAMNWLSGMVDWATSRAREPRVRPLEYEGRSESLAVNIASRAQRFAMCHELGHVMAFDRKATTVRAATVDGVAVSALPDSWEKEYAADRDGLAIYLRVLASQGKSAAAALIGAEVFLNAAGMLQESSAKADQDHPAPDDRIARVRHQFQQACGEQAAELCGPAAPVRKILDALRGWVTREVQRRRAETTRRLTEAHAEYAREINMTEAQMRAAAKHLSRFLLDSPGATLDFLYEQMFAPKGIDERDGGSVGRILALNAGLHFEKPLQEALEIPRLLGGRR